MWIAASVAHYLAGDKPLFLLPVALIATLAVSYVTRSSDRHNFSGRSADPDAVSSSTERDEESAYSVTP